MAVTVTFAWTRKANLGLILITFGLFAISQILILFHIKEFTTIATEENIPFLLGGAIGIAMGLTAITCFLAEHYQREGRIVPSILLLSTYLVLVVYFSGYFIIFQHVPNYVKELQVEDFFLFFWSQMGSLALASLSAIFIHEIGQR